MYNYQQQRPAVFTEEGVKTLMAVRDTALSCIEVSGAVTALKAWGAASGDSFLLLACLDYLVETGCLKEITGPNVAGQYRVFVGA